MNETNAIVVDQHGKFYVGMTKCSDEYPDAWVFDRELKEDRDAAYFAAKRCRGAVIENYGLESERIVFDARPMNYRPFSHTSDHGTVFKATRCDFVGGVTIIRARDVTNAQLASDIAQMIGYHALQIYPELNGFAGYNCIQWTYK
jgi:hypothetical protein